MGLITEDTWIEKVAAEKRRADAAEVEARRLKDALEEQRKAYEHVRGQYDETNAVIAELRERATKAESQLSDASFRSNRDCKRADASFATARALENKVAELEAQISGLSDANRRLAAAAERSAKDAAAATTAADEAQQDAYDLTLALLRSRMSKKTAAAVVRTLDAGNVKL